MIFALIMMVCVVAALLWALMRADRDYWDLHVTANRLRGENEALRAKNMEEKSKDA